MLTALDSVGNKIPLFARGFMTDLRMWRLVLPGLRLLSWPGLSTSLAFQDSPSVRAGHSRIQL